MDNFVIKCYKEVLIIESIFRIIKDGSLTLNCALKYLSFNVHTNTGYGYFQQK